MVFKKQKYSKKCFYLKCTYCLSKYLKQINWLRILIQLKFFFYKLPFEEFSGVTVKDKKIAQKWKTMELIQISLHFVHKITIITNFLAFFSFFCFFLKFLPPGSESFGNMRIRLPLMCRHAGRRCRMWWRLYAACRRIWSTSSHSSPRFLFCSSSVILHLSFFLYHGYR